MSRDQGGSYVINEDQSVTLVERGGSEALVNGRREDEKVRREAHAAAKAREKGEPKAHSAQPPKPPKAGGKATDSSDSGN